MTTQPVEANVVLTADNSQYDMAMDQSAMSTDKLGKSIDSLGQKINNLTKSAGKKLLGITAADVALITGATAAWASYEKQMARLQAQAAIVGRGREGEQKQMKEYTESVKGLRKEFGTTTSEAAALTQAIAKMADQTRGIKDLSHTFVEMSQATGESSTGLATSLLNLQKIMGTPQSTTQKYADQLTYLAAGANTSATALAEFSAQIAPMGRAIGMTQTEVTGFSNMFIKAGQDGYQAATAFNKVTQDITQAVQSGSPVMNKYANLLGVTTEQFKNMTGAEQVAGFLDEIARLGPRAAQELNRFGFDGIRMSKAITASVQASGGAMASVREAQYGFSSDAASEGAKAANSMVDTLQKLRQELQMTAESFATVLGPGINIVLKGIEKVAGAFNELMSGPLGKFLQVASAVLVPVGAITGAMLLMATSIAKAAAAFALLRNSAALGVFEGARGGARIVPETGPTGIPTGGFTGFGDRRLGPRGAQLAEGGTWLQRGLYNTGQQIGGGARTGTSWLGGTRLFAGPEGGGPNMFSRGAGSAISFTGQAISSQFDQMRYANPADRSQWLKRYFPGSASAQVAGGMGLGAMDATAAAKAEQRNAQAVWMASAGAGGGAEERAKSGLASADKAVAAAEAAEKATLANAGAQAKAAAEISAASKGQIGASAAVRAESANLARSLAGASLGAAKFGASAALKGGGAVMGALGGPVGIGLTALMAAPLLYDLGKKMFGQEDYKYEKIDPGTSPYLAAGGITPPTAPAAAAPGAVSPIAARRIDATSVARATSPSHKLSDPTLYNLSQEQVTTYIGANYDLISQSPGAMEAVKLDLIDKFGPEKAEQILSDLGSGNFSRGPGIFLEAAKSAEGKDRSKLLNIAGGMSTYAATRAPNTARMYQATGRQMTGLLRESLGGGARDANDVLEMLNESYGLDLRTQELVAKAGGGGYITPGATSRRTGAGLYETEPGKTPGETLAAKSDVQLLQQLIESQPAEQAEQLRAKLNIPLEATGKDLTAAIKTTLAGQGEKAVTPEQYLSQMVKETGPMGKAFEKSPLMQAAIAFGATNVSANVEAVAGVMHDFRDAGKSAPDITKAMGDIQSAIGNPDDPRYILAGYVSGQAQQELAMRMPMMTRADRFQAQVEQFEAVSAIKPTTPEQQQQLADETQRTQQAMIDQKAYFSQLLLAQEQYEIQRQRSQEDYHTQRTYQEHDYQLQRGRAEESFNRQRNRAVADYNRGTRRAWFDFNLQRSRAEADFNHQVEVTAKQAAMSVYSIYDRVQTERTSSAGWLLGNAQDQLTRMQEQAANLEELRRRGVSDNVIQQMGLTDPKNAQQLARFMTELTPQMIRQFNRVAGTERVKAAKALVTDESSLEWQEMRRGFRLNMSRGAEDMERQMKQSRQDFRRGLRRQREDFGISMDQQAEDYATMMGRQEEQYALTMDRAAEDMANMAKEIDGSLQQILRRGSRELTGYAKRQADAALLTFTDLKTNTSIEAIATMESLSSIFGFKYTAPTEGNASRGPRPTRDPGDLPQAYHEGGQIPGWSPGRDTTTVAVGGGEAIMRPEWARAMGKEYINAANHQAKHGGFAEGGVVDPDGRTSMDGEPVSRITKAQLLLAERLARANLSVMQGSWQSYSSYSGSSHMGPGVVDTSPGTFAWQKYLRMAGFAAWARNIPGAGYAGSGAHVHSVSRLDPGARDHAQLSSFARGEDGLGGSDYGPNPPIVANIQQLLSQFGELQLAAGAGGGGGGAPMNRRQILRQVLKELYPKSERAAHNLEGVHPLAKGEISAVINRYARRKVNTLMEEFGAPSAGAGSMPSAPQNVTGAQALVKRAMLGAGFSRDQWPALYQLVQHESGFNPNAQNPSSTAYGLFQFLDSTWAGTGVDKTSDPWQQSVAGLRYIKNRYDNPQGAWDFWSANHWYGDGSVFTSPHNIGVGEKGPEAVIPLNARGGEFMADVMGSVMGGRNVSAAGQGMSVYNTRIDRSTNFTGPITVQANDPHELLSKLRARQRVMALSRPSLTGSAA